MIGSAYPAMVILSLADREGFKIRVSRRRFGSNLFSISRVSEESLPPAASTSSPSFFEDEV
jgi:hypothetical protein